MVFSLRKTAEYVKERLKKNEKVKDPFSADPGGGRTGRTFFFFLNAFCCLKKKVFFALFGLLLLFRRIF